jgi:hypothetical protein
MPALTLLCFLHVCGNIISPSVVLLLWLRLLLSNLDYCRLTLSGNNLNAECKASTIRVASMQIVSMLSSLHTTPFTLYLGLSNLWEMIRFMMYVLIADLKAHVNLCNIEVDFLLVFSLYDWFDSCSSHRPCVVSLIKFVQVLFCLLICYAVIWADRIFSRKGSFVAACCQANSAWRSGRQRDIPCCVLRSCLEHRKVDVCMTIAHANTFRWFLLLFFDLKKWLTLPILRFIRLFKPSWKKSPKLAVIGACPNGFVRRDFMRGMQHVPVVRTLQSVTQAEKDVMQAKIKHEPLPEGFTLASDVWASCQLTIMSLLVHISGCFFNGRQYVDMDGERSQYHPELNAFLQKWIEEENAKSAALLTVRSLENHALFDKRPRAGKFVYNTLWTSLSLTGVPHPGPHSHQFNSIRHSFILWTVGRHVCQESSGECEARASQTARHASISSNTYKGASAASAIASNPTSEYPGFLKRHSALFAFRFNLPA